MKTTLRKEDILAELYTGKKFTTTEWKDNSYIHMVNGQIVDKDNQDFNLMGTPYDEWIEYIEVKTTEIKLDIMTNKEAIQALFNKERIKSASWKDDSYIHMVDGQIVDNDNQIFNLMQANVDDWVIVEACQISDNFNEIQELKAMVKELLENNNQTKEVSPKKNITHGTATDKEVHTHELLLAVYGVTSPKEIEEQFKEQLEGATSTADIQKTVCEYIPYPWIGGRALGTTTVYYTKMRNVIKTLKNEEYRDTGLSLFLPPQSAYEAVQSKNNNKKKEDIRNKKTIEIEPILTKLPAMKEIILSDEIPVKARQTLEREKAYWAYAYLTMTTGRRQVELLSTLEIKKEGKTWVYAGIVKDRGNGKTIEAFAIDDDFEFLSDLLDYLQDFITIEVNETIEKKLRAITDKKEREVLKKEYEELYFSESKINSKFNGTFTTALKRITDTNLTAREWRDLYAEILWQKEDSKKEGSHIDERDFKANVLGHEYDGSLSATEHYDVVKAV